MDREGDTIVSFDERGNAYQFQSGQNHGANNNGSLGLNVQYIFNDAFELSLDAHSSVSDFNPLGYGDKSTITVSPNNAYSQRFSANSMIPTVSFGFSDSGDGVDLRSQPDIVDFVDTRGGLAQWKTVETKIDQLQLTGNWKSREDGWIDSISFGVAHIRNANVSRFGENSFVDPFQGTGQPLSFYDTDVFHEVSGSDLLDQFDGGLDPRTSYYTFNFDEFVQVTADHLSVLDPQFFGADDEYLSIEWERFQGPRNNPSKTNKVVEETSSAYWQFLFDSDNHIIPFEWLTGIRYENTEVASESSFFAPSSIRWITPNEFAQNLSMIRRTSERSANYDVWLPSFNIRFDLRDDLLFRAAYSKSITRPQLNLLIAEQRVTSPANRVIRSSEEGNAKLEPYTAQNYDVSIEYYYSDHQYVSIGAFSKKVDGYPTNEIIQQTLFGLTDVYNGSRAAEIREELVSQGVETTNENVFNELIDEYPPEDGQIGIAGDENDPLFLWQTKVPVNGSEVTVEGFEFAWQQFLGDSGFGTLINYTKVNSDAPFQLTVGGFDNAFPSDQDFGNFVGFYDKYGLQVRLALHWRDRISTLTETNSGVFPIVTKSYHQLDGLISYEVSDHLTVFMEGINITNETQATYSIVESRLDSAQQFGPRYQVGFRSRF